MKTPTKPVSAGPPAALDPAREWHVRVSIGVIENVPADVLKAWIAVESFARAAAECWPGNAALAARMGITIRPAQSALDRLEDLGIVVRRRIGGNRRVLAMVRRTAGELSAAEWAAMSDRAARLAAGRQALTTAKAAERKRHQPKIRIVG